MALIERGKFLASLQEHFVKVEDGEGHCILLSGEAGIGKTTLVKAFCKQQVGNSNIYQGACDNLFTPRPLAPLYDILWQVNKDRWPNSISIEGLSALFANLFQELKTKKGKILIVFEDIHWADEGTLDFIRFFVKRIHQLPCLFVLTYRDNEIHSTHSLRNVLGELPLDSFTKIQLLPLSKEAVFEMAIHKGFNGEDVFSISGGNPFYVHEILASYSPGIPDNIKDSILSVYKQQKEGTKNAWQIWSVMPEGLEVDRVSKLKSALGKAIDHCFAISVIIVQNGKVVFKHELYRRTIEESLTLFKRIELNKMILELFLDSFEEKGEVERIVNYAKNANEKNLVVKYAPLAANKAVLLGAHKEASKLFLTAIEYFEGNDTSQLAKFYEAYAHECYRSKQIKEAISYTHKALNLWTQKADIEKSGDNLRFLSLLWWFDGNGKSAENFALQAIEMLKDEATSSTKAMAFSNMSQLKMLSDEPTEGFLWGERAIIMAKELRNEEILSHAMNNVGSIKMVIPSSEQEGITTLQQSLEIALKNSYYEQAARAYTNLGSCSVKIKDYFFAKRALRDGIEYCEEKDLEFWKDYMLSWKARLDLDIGNWLEAQAIADNLIKNENQPAIIKITAIIVLAKIKMRRGEEDTLTLLMTAKAMSFETRELQRIVPLMVALLEYEWLTGELIIEKSDIDQTLLLMQRGGIEWDKNEFAFWMKKADRDFVGIKKEGNIGNEARVLKAATFWQKSECPYERSLVLFEGDDDEKKNALLRVQDLGAVAVYQKMKQQMRELGIKNIPRGIRSSSRSNAALLSPREIDVLKLLKGTLHNKEIAAQLYISPKTVDHHVSNILFKLDADSRSKAVQKAVRMGILK